MAFPCPFSPWFLKFSGRRLYQSASNGESRYVPRHLVSLGTYILGNCLRDRWKSGEAGQGTVRDVNLVSPVNKGNTLVMREQQDRRKLIPPLHGAVPDLCTMSPG